MIVKERSARGLVHYVTLKSACVNVPITKVHPDESFDCGDWEGLTADGSRMGRPRIGDTFVEGWDLHGNLVHAFGQPIERDGLMIGLDTNDPTPIDDDERQSDVRRTREAIRDAEARLERCRHSTRPWFQRWRTNAETPT